MAELLSVDIPKNLIERFESLEDTLKQELVNKIFAEADRLGQVLAGIVIRDSLSGNVLKRRTGTLARSVVGRAETINGFPAIRVGIFRGPALSYAGILETGGVIKPKNAKALAIPVGEAVTPAGVSRFGGPRGYPGELQFVPFRNSGVAVGKLVDPSKAVEGQSVGDLEALYLLVRQVRIPETRWLSRPVRENLPLVARELAAFLRRELSFGSTE